MSEALWPMPPVSETTFDERAYDTIFTPKFFADLCSLMNRSQTLDTLAELREGHFHAVRAYFDAQYAFQDMKTLKEENRRLDQVAHDAERLCHTLASLFEYGATAQKLAVEIQHNETAYTSPEGHNLASFISPNLPHPLFAITALLSDLGASAERAQVREVQTEQERTNEISKLLESSDPNALSEYVLKQKLPPTIALPKGKRDHRPKSAAAVAFISAFAPVWAKLGAGTYSAGHTVEGLTGTKSRAVDAVFHTIAQLDSGCKRASITTAFRSWEKSIQKTS